MALPAPLSAFFRDNQDWLLAVLLLTTLLLLLTALMLLSRIGRLHRLYARLTRGTSGGNLEEILQTHIHTVADVAQRVESLKQAVERLEEAQKGCVQRIGLVRFDAFDDVGGEQSFAIVLLDAHRSGVAISSLFSRTDVRIYAKAIVNGQPSHPLSREEQQAMAQAEGR